MCLQIYITNIYFDLFSQYLNTLNRLFHINFNITQYNNIIHIQYYMLEYDLHTDNIILNKLNISVKQYNIVMFVS